MISLEAMARIVLDGRVLSAHYPGIGRYTYNLLRALPRVASAAEITVLTGPEDERFPFAALDGVERLPFDVPIRSARNQLALPRLLRRYGAAVFHAPYFLTAYRPPCPLVVTMHDTIALRSAAFLPSLVSRLLVRLGTRLALAAASAVITVSEVSRRDLRRFFAAQRITVIPEAAAPEFRPATPEAVAAVRRRLDLPERYLLFVGTNKPHKNLPRLVAALAEMKEPCPLVLAGRRDPRFGEDEAVARRLGVDVRFLGEVADGDLPALLTAATVFVLPSSWEGFGLPVVEAMACGVPVACSGVASLPEVAGDAAAFFDPESTTSMATVLAELLRDPERRRRLAEQGLIRAAELSWERTAELTYEVYRRWP